MLTLLLRSAPFLALLLAVVAPDPVSSAAHAPSTVLQRPIPVATPTATPQLLPLGDLRVDDMPANPSGLRFAEPIDCDASSAVRAAAGGDAATCHDRLNSGTVVATWDRYDDRNCTKAAACIVNAFGLYDFTTHERVATAEGDSEAIAVPAAALGKCYVLRVQRRDRESGNSRARCVTVVRTTTRATYGPAEIGDFQAMVHDNSDHAYCTRNSWDSGWASESWGFNVRTRVTQLDPNVPPTNLRLTIGWVAVDHPGRGPLPCRESLLHVWRDSLTFRVPRAEPATVTHAVLSFDTTSGHAGGCFLNVWKAHHWYYKDPATFSFSATIGANDGHMLDAVDPYGRVTFSGTHATYDLSNNAAFLGGLIEIVLALPTDELDTSEIPHAVLHEGHYLHTAGSTACAAINPSIAVVSVRTQTTAPPAIFQSEDSVQNVRTHPDVLETATPSQPEISSPRKR